MASELRINKHHRGSYKGRGTELVGGEGGKDSGPLISLPLNNLD